jgi:hypothetical protein
MSPLRTTALIIVSAATVAAVVVAVVTAWPGRIGLVGAVVAAWIGLWLSWREQQDARMDNHEQLMDVHYRAYESLVAERASNDRIVTLLRDRNALTVTTLNELRGELTVRQRELAERRREISRLQGDNAALRIDVAALASRIDVLSSQVEAMENLVDAPDGAEVLPLPRRPMKHQRRLWADDEAWETDDMPSVAELLRDEIDQPAEARRQA